MDDIPKIIGNIAQLFSFFYLVSCLVAAVEYSLFGNFYIRLPAEKLLRLLFGFRLLFRVHSHEIQHAVYGFFQQADVFPVCCSEFPCFYA